MYSHQIAFVLFHGTMLSYYYYSSILAAAEYVFCYRCPVILRLVAGTLLLLLSRLLLVVFFSVLLFFLLSSTLHTRHSYVAVTCVRHFVFVVNVGEATEGGRGSVEKRKSSNTTSFKIAATNQHDNNSARQLTDYNIISAPFLSRCSLVLLETHIL